MRHEIRDWLGFTPKRQTKRLIKKWENRYRMETMACRCNHEWLSRWSQADSFDLICARCHSLSYTIPF